LTTCVPVLSTSIFVACILALVGVNALAGVLTVACFPAVACVPVVDGVVDAGHTFLLMSMTPVKNNFFFFLFLTGANDSA